MGIKITSELDFSQFFCWNIDCPDYGIKNQRNIVFKERYGKNNHALLKFKTCNGCFSETKGTVFFGLNTPDEEVLRALELYFLKKEIFATLQGLQDIVKTQFVDSSRLQESIQKKLQLIFSLI